MMQNLLNFCFVVVVFLCSAVSGVEEEPGQWTDNLVPDFEVDHEDAYVCFTVSIPDVPSRIVEIEPLSKQDVVHHMLLFGCETDEKPTEPWECLHHNICPGNSLSHFMYGWGKNAPVLRLPDKVGYSVGPGSGITNLVLQVHYLTLRPKNDHSGIRIKFSQQPTPFSAGLITYARMFTVPPKKPSYLVENQCCYRGFEPLHTFAFRVHTHWMGRSVWLDRVWNDSYTEQLMENSPQKPQGFYPTGGHVLWPGDRIDATCKFDSSKETHAVSAGATSKDEMCNLYLMSYSEVPYFLNCNGGWASYSTDNPGGIPKNSQLQESDPKDWNPPPPLNIKGGDGPKFGQISGVVKGADGNIWVLHRADRTWESNSFDDRNQITYKEPIKEDTIFLLDADTGEVILSFGGGLLYMPHMMSIDREGMLWVTDVGLHQAIKLNPEDGSVLLEIGEALKPGDGDTHLCKPTQVAVSKNGDIFISDGYCNSRVARFTSNGTFVGEYKTQGVEMSVPHSLLLDECEDAVMVADRENKQVHRFSITTGELKHTYNMAWGYPYALTPGPYGSVMVLLWDREQDKAKLIYLTLGLENGAAGDWDIPGTSTPHDIALTSAPTSLTGPGERLVAVLVAETRPTGSLVRKYVMTPQGFVPYEKRPEVVSAASSEATTTALATVAAQKVEEKVNAAKASSDKDEETQPEDANKDEGGTGENTADQESQDGGDTEDKEGKYETRASKDDTPEPESDVAHGGEDASVDGSTPTTQDGTEAKTDADESVEKEAQEDAPKDESTASVSSEGTDADKNEEQQNEENKSDTDKQGGGGGGDEESESKADSKGAHDDEVTEGKKESEDDGDGDGAEEKAEKSTEASQDEPEKKDNGGEGDDSHEDGEKEAKNDDDNDDDSHKDDDKKDESKDGDGEHKEEEGGDDSHEDGEKEEKKEDDSHKDDDKKDESKDGDGEHKEEEKEGEKEGKHPKHGHGHHGHHFPRHNGTHNGTYFKHPHHPKYPHNSSQHHKDTTEDEEAAVASQKSAKVSASDDGDDNDDDDDDDDKDDEKEDPTQDVYAGLEETESSSSWWSGIPWMWVGGIGGVLLMAFLAYRHYMNSNSRQFDLLPTEDPDKTT